METEDKGRGVFCMQDINAGDTIEVCQLIILPSAELPIIHKTKLHDYYFLWGQNHETCAIALGFGSLYNHDDDSNADFIMDLENDTIDIVALKDIAAGVEITINYHGEQGNPKKLWF
jgi:SET domain-containing protein